MAVFFNRLFLMSNNKAVKSKLYGFIFLLQLYNLIFFRNTYKNNRGF